MDTDLHGFEQEGTEGMEDNSLDFNRKWTLIDANLAGNFNAKTRRGRGARVYTGRR